MAKLPKQLYVTAQDRGIDPTTGPNHPFGFLNAYEPGKVAFEKKRHTQEDWAYHFSYTQDAKLEQHGNEWYKVGWKWNYIQHPTDRRLPGTQTREDVHELIQHPPKVWDNDPLTGFRILRSVSRYSTSNKLWRILDPRLVEFEISTGVLEQIIDDATILKGGLIDAKCAWMANKNLVVVA
jgi:hypothetical protein